jgi:glycosyltransferase involved in cell wall biosynthesis
VTEGTLGATMARTTARERVLVVGPLPPPWHGGSVATEYVLKSGVAEQWDVVHLDTADRRGLRNIGQLDAGNIIAALKHGLQFIVLLVMNRPAVVYVPIAQNTLGLLRDFLFIIPSLLTRRRVVLHVHGGGFGNYYAGASGLMRLLLRAVISRANRVIVLGDSLRGTLAGIVAPERIRAVPNGMPDPFPDAPVRSVSDEMRVLYLANLIPSKGFLDVLHAIELLVAAGVPVHLDLAGGYESAVAEREAAPVLERLGDRVTQHGVVGPARKRELLAAADVFAFPTYYEYEGHPFVMLEAMAAGLPVVTTAHAAIPETVTNERDGLIVPARDPQALADALLRLANDPALRVQLGRAARARFLEGYTLGTWSDSLVRVIREAAA